MVSVRWLVATLGGFLVALIVGTVTFATPVRLTADALITDPAGFGLHASLLIGGTLCGTVAGASVALPFRIRARSPLAREDVGNLRLLGSLYGLLGAGLGLTYLKGTYAFLAGPGSGFLALLVAPAIGAIVAGLLSEASPTGSNDAAAA